MKALTWVCVVIWFLRLALGAGAFYAALRLWNSRRHPLIFRLMIYICAFIIEALTAIALVFAAEGVVFTPTFAAVMFFGAFVGDVVRLPLIAYLIKGPEEVELPEAKASGDMPPEFWKEEFREAVIDGIKKAKSEGLI